MLLLQARIARMTPAARAKYEEKAEKQRAKKQAGARMKMVKM